MLRIGDFARAGRVTIKALRHYDAMGLLRPVHVDRATGYRYYSPAQLTVLNRLVIYKNLGFSLSEMRAMLDESCPPSRLRELLQARRSELARRIEFETAQLAYVEHRIKLLESDERRRAYDVVIRDTEPAEFVSMRRILPDYDALEPLLRTMSRTIPKSRIQGYGAIWHRCPSSGTAIDCEALVFLKSRAVNSQRFAASKVASVVYRAADDDPFPEVYRAALDVIGGGDYEIVWPMREIYHTEDLSVTEVQFPIRPLAG